MFNECGMTSRWSFGSKLYVILQEGSAGAGGVGLAPGGRFGKAFLGSEDRRPGTAGTSCLHVVSLQMSLVPLQAEPQGAVGMCWGGLAERPAWPGAHGHARLPHSNLAWRSCSPPGTGKVSAWSRRHPSIIGSGVWHKT